MCLFLFVCMLFVFAFYFSHDKIGKKKLKREKKREYKSKYNIPNIAYNIQEAYLCSWFGLLLFFLLFFVLFLI